MGTINDYEYRITMSTTDSYNYVGAESGCFTASSVLGYPSRCLTNCPFRTCVLDMPLEEKRRLVGLVKSGAPLPSLAGYLVNYPTHV